MSLVLPNAVLWSRLPWRRQLVFAAALPARGDASIRQIQTKTRLRTTTIIEELDILEAEGYIIRDRGKAHPQKDKRRNGYIIAVSAALAGAGWSAIPASAYEHLPTAIERWNALLVSTVTKSGNILTYYISKQLRTALALTHSLTPTSPSVVLTAKTSSVPPEIDGALTTGADVGKALVTRS